MGVKKKYEIVFGQPPPDNDNQVYCLNKAAGVMNGVFGLSPPPTDLNREEFDYLDEACLMLCQKDNNVCFGISMALVRIMQVNPHFKEFIKETTDKPV